MADQKFSKRRPPKYLTGDGQSGKDIADAHESRTMKGLGGIVTIGSGNKGMKGDGWVSSQHVDQRLMVENKATAKRQMAVKLDWLEKLENEAFAVRREPVLALSFEAHTRGPRDYALIPWHRLEELLELERESKQREG